MRSPVRKGAIIEEGILIPTKTRDDQEDDRFREWEKKNDPPLHEQSSSIRGGRLKKEGRNQEVRGGGIKGRKGGVGNRSG